MNTVIGVYIIWSLLTIAILYIWAYRLKKRLKEKQREFDDLKEMSISIINRNGAMFIDLCDMTEFVLQNDQLKPKQDVDKN